MSGGVAVLLALAGVLLIILGAKGTYADALSVLLHPGNNGSEPTAQSGSRGDTTINVQGGGAHGVK